MSREFLQSLESRHLLAAGALDASFGIGGATAVRVEGGGTVKSINALSDGKLLLTASFDGVLSFFRLSADGTADNTFGIAGRVDTGISTTPADVAVAPDGRIAIIDSGQLAIFQPNGAADTSVSDDGVIIFEQVLGEGWNTDAKQVEFTPDGKLIIAAPAKTDLSLPSDEPQLLILKLNSDGSLDFTFDDDGVKFVGSERVDAMAVAGDGTILVSTHYFTTALNDTVEEPVSHVQIHRFTADTGSDDPAPIGGGLDNPEARVKNLETGPDGSVAALVYDYNFAQSQYVYSIRRYAAGGAAEVQQFPLQSPIAAKALEADLSGTGQAIVTGIDNQGLWFTQRYTYAGYLDPSYGNLGTGSPNLEGPHAQLTGDATVLADGSVVIGNTRQRSDGTINDLVIAKVAGGDGTPPDVRLNLRGTLIAYGTAAADHISLYIRSRDGRLIYRSDEFVKSFAPSKVKRIAIFAGAGDDTVTIGTGVRGSYAQGDAGNDTLTGGDFSDILLGGDGDDSLTGGLAPDRMFGDGGSDILYGNGGRDYMFGGAGNDDLFGNGHADTLTGDDGDDRLFGGGDADLLYGSAGTDSAAYDALDTVSPDVETIITTP